MISNFNKIITDLLQDTASGFFYFLPNLFLVSIILIIGWIIATTIGKISSILLQKIGIDKPLNSKEWNSAIKKADINTSPSVFLGKIIKWIIFVLSIWIALISIELNSIALLISTVAGYIPNILTAIVIFVLAIMIGETVYKFVVVIIKKLNIPHAKLIGIRARSLIWSFGGLAILVELNIAEKIIIILFSGFMLFIVVGGSIAVGIIGKDIAKDVINEIGKTINRKT